MSRKCKFFFIPNDVITYKFPLDLYNLVNKHLSRADIYLSLPLSNVDQHHGVREGLLQSPQYHTQLVHQCLPGLGERDHRQYTQPYLHTESIIIRVPDTNIICTFTHIDIFELMMLVIPITKSNS